MRVESLSPSILPALSISICLLLGGCAGYSPQNSYWDARVDELCKKDGGVTVFEAIELPTAQYERHLQHSELWLPRTYGLEARRSDALYARYHNTMLTTGNPEVSRSTLSIVRGSDHKVLATRVTYRRNFERRRGYDSQMYKHECPKMSDEEFFSKVILERRDP
jgi:hypothetical protein